MEIVSAELTLAPCPLCGRRPELIRYDLGGQATSASPFLEEIRRSPNYKEYYRLVCNHGVSSSSNRTSFNGQEVYPYRTDVCDMVCKCQQQWNNGSFPFKPHLFPLNSKYIKEVSHEEFVEFLGGEQDGSGC